MAKNTYRFENNKIPEKNVVKKESTKKKIIRLCALFGALLILGGFLLSLIMYIF